MSVAFCLWGDAMIRFAMAAAVTAILSFPAYADLPGCGTESPAGCRTAKESSWRIGPAVLDIGKSQCWTMVRVSESA
jgi:hypothetical protein